MHAHPCKQLQEIAIAPIKGNRPFLCWRPECEVTPESEIVITFNEFYNDVLRIANTLKTMGISKGDKICVWFGDGPEYIKMVFAIWMCNAIFVPLPITPSETELNYPAQVGAKLTIVDQEYKAIGENKALYDASWATGEPINLDSIKLNVFNPAYSTPSSGSGSGVPKLIGNNLSGIIGRISSSLAILGIDDEHCFLGFLDRMFDASLYDFLCCLYQGTTLYLVPEHLRTDANQVPEFILNCPDGRRPNVGVITPSVFKAVVSSLYYPDTTDLILPKIMAVGSALNLHHVKEYLKKGGFLFNGFGPTECQIASTVTPIFLSDIPDDASEVRAPLIRQLGGIEQYGKLAGVTFFMREAPRTPKGEIIKNKEGKIEFGPIIPLEKIKNGTLGELLIGGGEEALGLGFYINNETEQEAKFLKTEFGLLYASDDEMLWEDNSLYFIRRYNRAIKRNEQFVDLDGVEIILGEMTAIAQAIVNAYPRPSGGKSMIAFIQLEPGISHDVYFQQINTLPKKFQPDYAFEISALTEAGAGAGGNKGASRKIGDLIKRMPTLIRKEIITEPLSQIGLDIRRYWYEATVPNEISTRFHLGADQICFDTKLSQIGGDSINKMGLITHLNETYVSTLGIKWSQAAKQLAIAISWQVTSDCTLSDIEKTILNAQKLTTFSYDPPNMPVGQFWHYIHTRHAHTGDYLRLISRGNESVASFHIDGRTYQSAGSIWQAAGISDPDFMPSDKPIHVYVHHGDAIETLGYCHLCPDFKPLIEHPNTTVIFVVPDIGFIPADARMDAGLITATHERKFRREEFEFEKFFSLYARRYRHHFTKQPAPEELLVFAQQFHELGLCHIDDPNPLFFNPYFQFLRHFCDIIDNGNISLQTTQYEYLMMKGVRFESRSPLIIIDEQSPWLSPDQHQVLHVIKHGHRIPIFLVHPITGDAPTAYFHIANSLPEDHPVYTFIEPKKASSLEALADYYCHLITQMCKDKHVILAGWSYGGLLAYLITARLEAKGYEVMQVINIDCPSPDSLFNTPGLSILDHAHLLINIITIEQFNLLPLGQKILFEDISRSMGDITLPYPHLPEELVKAQKHFLSVRNFFCKMPPLCHKKSADRKQQFYDAITHCCTLFTLKAAFEDKWPIINAPMLVIEAAEKRHGLNEHTDATEWAALAPNHFKTAAIPGDHFTMIDNAALSSTISTSLMPLLKSSIEMVIKNRIQAMQQAWLTRTALSDRLGQLDIKVNCSGHNINFEDMIRILLGSPTSGAGAGSASAPSTSRGLLLWGPSGCGKSSILNTMISHLVADHDDTYLIPVSPNKADTLTQALSHYHFTDIEIAYLQSYDKLIFMSDGLDEKLGEINWEDTFEMARWPKAKWLLSSRLPLTLRHIDSASIQPVDYTEVRSVLDRLGTTATTVIDEDSDCLSLLSSPIMLRQFTRICTHLTSPIDKLGIYQQIQQELLEGTCAHIIKRYGLPINCSEEALSVHVFEFLKRQAFLSLCQDTRLLIASARVHSLDRLCLESSPFSSGLDIHRSQLEFASACYIVDQLEQRQYDFLLHTHFEDAYFSGILEFTVGILDQRYGDGLHFQLDHFLLKLMDFVKTKNWYSLLKDIVQLEHPELHIFMKDLSKQAASPGHFGNEIATLLMRMLTLRLSVSIANGLSRYSQYLTEQANADPRIEWQALPPEFIAAAQPYFTLPLERISLATGMAEHYVFNHEDLALDGYRAFLRQSEPFDHTNSRHVNNLLKGLYRLEQRHRYHSLAGMLHRYIHETFHYIKNIPDKMPIEQIIKEHNRSIPFQNQFWNMHNTHSGDICRRLGATDKGSFLEDTITGTEALLAIGKHLPIFFNDSDPLASQLGDMGSFITPLIPILQVWLYDLSDFSTPTKRKKYVQEHPESMDWLVDNFDFIEKLIDIQLVRDEDLITKMAANAILPKLKTSAYFRAHYQEIIPELLGSDNVMAAVTLIQNHPGLIAELLSGPQDALTMMAGLFSSLSSSKPPPGPP